MLTKRTPLQINIPDRKNVPTTHLYIEIETLVNEPDNRPIVFLLPGGPGSDHQVYKKHSTELAEAARLVYFDPRGCGESDRGNAKTYTLDNYIDDVEAVRKQLNFTKIIVLGTSYGGVVAQGYALRYPTALEKLILVVTAPSYHFLAVAKKNVAARGTPEQIKACEDLWAGTFKDEAHCLNYFSTLASLYSDKAAQENSTTPYVNLTPGSYSFEALNLGFATFLREFDYTNDLAKITCPTLIIAGEHDWICDPQFSHIIAQKIPHSILKIFNASHAVAIDAHEEYIQAVKAFITKI